MRSRIGKVLGFLKSRWIRVLFLLGLLGLIASQQYALNTMSWTMGTLSASNKLLVGEIGAQNVAIAQLNQEKADLTAQLGQAFQLLERSVPIEQVLWCTGMPIEQIPAQYADITRVAYLYLTSLPTEVAVEGVCMDYHAMLISEVTGELYISTTRVFSGGAREILVVYFGEVPGSSGSYRVIGHYDVILRKWVPRAG